VHPEAFGHLTAALLPLAPTALLLEGGYNLGVTAACVEACVRVMLGEAPAPLRGSRWAALPGWLACVACAACVALRRRRRRRRGVAPSAQPPRTRHTRHAPARPRARLSIQLAATRINGSTDRHPAHGRARARAP
jgi:hypothetical protein